ncbi:biotin--acetyl-CoA-carboxylase ligase [Thiobacillus denitrificans ATCC 25259]|uniref:Bifunctional ligase/repressor BirA n=1 Tax=Thiobacillus denitrificans (strain ATCC 25259 / T1) TaxID=292415 RepID=Q3SLJ7_THIDA|nr:biotin--[acetyl-CoA-carboxylase] ligase [Thiobacillus denitrificans]AAZ96413.1 biotin--acetyl-CoA-carboxylase ligase [Thiobacillus denitrificans ATCC 25259]
MHTRLHKDLFPILRRLGDGRFHSGEGLAQEFGLSRSTVFNVLAQAQEMGLTIHAVRGRGYQVPRPVEWLDRRALERALGARAARYSLHLLDDVESTNACVMSAALGGAPDGTLYCAEHQANGRGRRGRRWHSVLGGGLTFSLLCRFETGLQSLAGLSLAAGLAVARAVNRHSRHPARLKWPNDVLVDHRKLAGILVEVQGDMHGPAFAVIGIGINVRLDAAQRDAVDQALIDLAEIGVTVGRNRLLADCLLELDTVLAQFRQQGFAGLREAWLALDAYAGRCVTLSLPDARSVNGVASGVDETGAFLLQAPNASVAPYSGGEISLRLDARR